MSKSVEKCREYFSHLLTFFDVTPFRWPLLRFADLFPKDPLFPTENLENLRSGNVLRVLGGQVSRQATRCTPSRGAGIPWPWAFSARLLSKIQPGNLMGRHLTPWHETNTYPDLPFLVFLENGKENHQKKPGFSILCGPLKSLGRKGKTLKKARNSLQNKKARNSKKTRKGRSG